MSRRIPIEQWADPRHRDGAAAEQIAASWLTARGWRILAERYRLGRHDLDLVATRGTLVAFIEVKWRARLLCGAPEEAVGPRKRRIIEQVAWSWLLRHGTGSETYRFDVMALTGPLDRCQVRHIEDAWRPSWR